jgi:hypothetical protein
LGGWAAGVIAGLIFTMFEWYPIERTKREMNESREDLNARYRQELGLWGAGVQARSLPFRRFFVRHPRLYFIGLPTLLVAALVVLAIDVASW